MAKDRLSFEAKKKSLRKEGLRLEPIRKLPICVGPHLKHTRSLGVEYWNGLTELDGFSDVDFATSDQSRRRVTSGYAFRLWGEAVS